MDNRSGARHGKGAAFRFGRLRRTAVAATAALMVAAGGAAAYADGLVADADAFVTQSPNGNGAEADQTVGTTEEYDFSALVKNTGNENNDVFPGTVVVSITRGGPWLNAQGGSPASFNFSGYETPQAGKVRISVPCEASGVTETMTVRLDAADSTNGKTLSPNSVNLSFEITGTGTCAPTNSAPVVAADEATVTVDEADTATNTGTWSDPDGDAVIVSSSIGDVSTDSDGTWSWSLDTVDGPRDSDTVTITADDGTTTSATTFQLVVSNVAPSVTASIDSTINCQTNAKLTLSFTDPGVEDANWAVEINWGDGSTETYQTADQGSQPDRTHLYTSPGNYTAAIEVTDRDDDTGTDNDNDIEVKQAYSTTFLAPFDGSSPSNLVTNTMKNGRVVPVKVKILDLCTKTYVTDPTTQVSIGVKHATVSDGTAVDGVEAYADAGQSSAGTNLFRWSSDGFWIYNLDSKNLGLVTNDVYRVDAYVAGVQATKTTWALLKPVK